MGKIAFIPLAGFLFISGLVGAQSAKVTVCNQGVKLAQAPALAGPDQPDLVFKTLDIGFNVIAYTVENLGGALAEGDAQVHLLRLRNANDGDVEVYHTDAEGEWVTYLPGTTITDLASLETLTEETAITAELPEKILGKIDYPGDNEIDTANNFCKIGNF